MHRGERAVSADSVAFNPRALLVLVGFLALVWLALVSNRGAWFYVAEVIASTVIVLGIAGLLNPPPSTTGQQPHARTDDAR